MHEVVRVMLSRELKLTHLPYFFDDICQAKAGKKL